MKPKNILCVFCATLALCVCLTSVSCDLKKTDIYGLLAELCDAFEGSADVGRGVKYAENELEAQDIRALSAERFGRLYTGRNEPPPCFSSIEGYALRLPSDESGFEIHIIKCVNRSDVGEVSNMLLRRVEMISSAEIRQYAPSAYMKYFENAEVYARGRYAFLLATPDNESCIRIIKSRGLA